MSSIDLWRQASLSALAVAATLLFVGCGDGQAGHHEAGEKLNPCAAKSLNPCAAKKAANPCNPCGAKNAGNPCAGNNPCNPCGAKNPCNPCGGASVEKEQFLQGSKPLSGKADVALGSRLWNDRTLGKTGLACSSCHVGSYALMNPTFKQPYPHRVAMPYQQAGAEQVSAAEMVQFCMLVPMGAEPLAWDSDELASLAAYVESLQAGYTPVAGAANPCNPCAAKNPCNPCAAKNPCNPCGAKNPCNPCGR